MTVAVHTIPVPKGWSPEQTWEVISRQESLPEGPVHWENIVVRDGKFSFIADNREPAEDRLLREKLQAEGMSPSWTVFYVNKLKDLRGVMEEAASALENNQEIPSEVAKQLRQAVEEIFIRCKCTQGGELMPNKVPVWLITETVEQLKTDALLHHALAQKANQQPMQEYWAEVVEACRKALKDAKVSS